MSHAALDDVALANHAPGEAQHEHGFGYRFDRLPVERAEYIECRSSPSNQVIALIARPTDEVGDDGQGECSREVGHTIDLPLVERSFNDAAGRVIDGVTDRAQRTRQH